MRKGVSKEGRRKEKWGKESDTEGVLGRKRQAKTLVSINPNHCALDACLQIRGKRLKRKADDKLSIHR